MKKIVKITLLMVFMAITGTLVAQSGNTFTQPREVVGKRINASGWTYQEYNAQFDYTSGGKLDRFQFAEYGLSIIYEYEGDFLTEKHRYRYQGTDPDLDDWYYTYENGRIVRMDYCYWDDNIPEHKYTLYIYYDDGRLARKNYGDFYSTYINAYSLYEYADEGKTKIESYYKLNVQGANNEWNLIYRNTYHYDDNYTLLSEQKDSYNNDGEISSSKRTLYTYYSDGNLETEISQTFTDGLWVNNTIHICIYGDDGHITEQQNGVWSDELGDWDISKKTIHELSNDGALYTVSFYKKTNNEWTRDVFYQQKMFFDPLLVTQQNSLAPFKMFYINQFEFNMVETNTPTYMHTSDKSTPSCNVYPNPGNDLIRIETPFEGCVVRFYNMNGRQMLAQPFDFSTEVSAIDWAPGIYLWEIWNGPQKQAVGKWIKE